MEVEPSPTMQVLGAADGARCCSVLGAGELDGAVGEGGSAGVGDGAGEDLRDAGTEDLDAAGR